MDVYARARGCRVGRVEAGREGVRQGQGDDGLADLPRTTTTWSRHVGSGLLLPADGCWRCGGGVVLGRGRWGMNGRKGKPQERARVGASAQPLPPFLPSLPPPPRHTRRLNTPCTRALCHYRPPPLTSCPAPAPRPPWPASHHHQASRCPSSSRTLAGTPTSRRWWWRAAWRCCC